MTANEGQLSREELIKEQQTTLTTKRMKYGLPAKFLFGLMDLFYGKKATLSKFLVLEIVARMPYAAWEQVSYVAITHTHSTPKFARKIHDVVLDSREQQDNETWHLLILEEMLQKKGIRQGLIKIRVIPQVLAYIYYHISWLLYVIKPRMSHQLNAEFEDHAEHEYAQYVVDHPHLEEEKWNSSFKDDYGNYETVADLLRRISLDEREHKQKSLDQIEQARFSQMSEEVD